MAAVARMEHSGTPIDTGTLGLLREHWTTIRARLIERIDAGYNVFDGTTFKRDRFGNYLARHGIPWPHLESGELALDDDTFRQMARAYPKQIGPLRELRVSLSQLRLNDLAVGSDGRNRCLLSPFRSRTGRNQPSNTKFAFGPAVWIRGLIQPAPGAVHPTCSSTDFSFHRTRNRVRPSRLISSIETLTASLSPSCRSWTLLTWRSSNRRCLATDSAAFRCVRYQLVRR